jgi:hypothetical protein
MSRFSPLIIKINYLFAVFCWQIHYRIATPRQQIVTGTTRNQWRRCIDAAVHIHEAA